MTIESTTDKPTNASEAQAIAEASGIPKDSYTMGIKDPETGTFQRLTYHTKNGEGALDVFLDADGYSSPAPGIRAVDGDGNPADISKLARPGWIQADFDAGPNAPDCFVGQDCFPYVAEKDGVVLIPLIIESPGIKLVEDDDGDLQGVYDENQTYYRVAGQNEAAELAEWSMSDTEVANSVGEKLKDLREYEGGSDWGIDLVKDEGPLDPIDMLDVAARARFKEQCFLLANLREFATFNQRIDPKFSWAGAHNDSQRLRLAITLAHGESNQIVNKLTQNNIQQHFFELLPAQMSVLVPTIRIFKIVTDTAGCKRTTEVPFYNNPIDDMSDYGGSNRTGHDADGNLVWESTPGQGDGKSVEHYWENYEFGRGLCGIKSFSWDYVGNNPVSARTDINAKLVLHFQKFEDIVRPRLEEIPDPRGGGIYNNWSYAELAMRSGNVNGQKVEVNGTPIDPYRLRAHVGWAIPDDYDGVDFTDEQKLAIDESFVTLYLTVIDHTFDIKDDATVDFTIEYKAYIESTFGDPAKADILLTEEISKKRKYRNQKIREAKETCDAETVKELKKKFQEEADLEKQESYETIIKGLEQWAGWINGLPAPTGIGLVEGIDGSIEFANRMSRIYNIFIPYSELRVFINDGPFQYDGSAKWLSEQLGGTGAPSEYQVKSNKPSEEIADRIEAAGGFGTGDGSGVSAALANLTVYGPTTVEEHDEKKDGQLQWFYFGDLIHVGMERLEQNAAFSSFEGNASEGPDIIYKSRIVLGPMDVIDPLTEQVYQVNLADIPISVNYFMDWFMQKILSKNEAVWPLMAFIREALNDLVIRVMNDSEFCFGGTVKQKAIYNSSYFVAKAVNRTEEETRDAWGTSSAYAGQMDSLEKFELESFSYYDMSGLPSNRIYTDKITKENLEKNGCPNPLLGTFKDDLQEKNTISCEDLYYKYVVITAGSSWSSQLEGIKENDLEAGVQWYHIGSPTGPVKTIKFNKTDMKGVKEARFFNEGFNGLSQLREPYDVDIKLYGMPRVFPGQMCYIDPIGLGSALGQAHDMDSLAYLLGFGGYHQMTKIKNSIEPGKYETSIHAKWVQSGNKNDPRRGQMIGQGDTDNCKVDPDAFGTGDADATLNTTAPSPPPDPPREPGKHGRAETARESAHDEVEYYCFVAGTTVSVLGTNDLIEYINIENIKVGDMVLSYDLSTMKTQPAQVIDTMSPIHDDIVEFVFANGTRTKHTLDHAYYVVDKGWSSYTPDLTRLRYSDKSPDLSRCVNIEVGDLLISDTGCSVELVAINIMESEPTTTYNIVVDNNSNYFADGILVHNEAI